MSLSKFLVCAAAAGALTLPVALSSTAATASAPAGRSGQGCTATSYTGAHWATTHKQYAVVTHSYQLGLPGDGTYTESHSLATRHTVHSSYKVTGKASYSEDAIFESVKVSVGGSVAHFHTHTKSKSVRATITIHNKRGNATYVMYQGVTRYYGDAKYYDCVPDAKGSTVGTVKVTRRAPWKTYAGAGGGAVACHAKPSSALQKAAQKFC